MSTPASPRTGRLLPARTAWLRLHAWAHRGPVRAAVTKVVLTLVGVVVIVAGIAMLVLPGPGLVAIVMGLAVLAAEWDWAKALLHRARVRLEAARAATLPRNASWGRRAAVAGSAAALGAASWVFSAVLMGASPAVVTQAWTSLVSLGG